MRKKQAKPTVTRKLPTIVPAGMRPGVPPLAVKPSPVGGEQMSLEIPTPMITGFEMGFTPPAAMPPDLAELLKQEAAYEATKQMPFTPRPFPPINTALPGPVPAPALPTIPATPRKKNKEESLNAAAIAFALPALMSLFGGADMGQAPGFAAQALAGTREGQQTRLAEDIQNYGLGTNAALQNYKFATDARDVNATNIDYANDAALKEWTARNANDIAIWNQQRSDEREERMRADLKRKTEKDEADERMRTLRDYTRDILAATPATQSVVYASYKPSLERHNIPVEIDPATGKPVPVESVRRETAREGRAERIQKAKDHREFMLELEGLRTDRTMNAIDKRGAYSLAAASIMAGLRSRELTMRETYNNWRMQYPPGTAKAKNASQADVSKQVKELETLRRAYEADVSKAFAMKKKVYNPNTGMMDADPPQDQLDEADRMLSDARKGMAAAESMKKAILEEVGMVQDDSGVIRKRNYGASTTEKPPGGPPPGGFQFPNAVTGTAPPPPASSSGPAGLFPTPYGGYASKATAEALWRKEGKTPPWLKSGGKAPAPSPGGGRITGRGNVGGFPYRVRER